MCVKLTKFLPFCKKSKNIYHRPSLVFKAFCRLPTPVIDNTFYSDKKYKSVTDVILKGEAK